MSNSDGEQQAASDSRVNNRLALDRTFISWLQTAIAMISLALAIAGFLPKSSFPANVVVRALAVMFIVQGVFVAFAGVRRYAREAKLLAVPGFEQPTRDVIVAAVLAAVIGLIAIVSVVI